MNTLLSLETRNNVLFTMAAPLDTERMAINNNNNIGIRAYKGNDISMLDRLKVNNAKVDEMVIAAKHLASQVNPIGVEPFSFKHKNGMKVYNKTASLLNVDLLIIAANTNRIYTKKSIKNNVPKTITKDFNIEDLKNEVVQSKSTQGTGGMASKIEAVEISKNANIETWIINGLEDHFKTDAFENKVPFIKIK